MQLLQVTRIDCKGVEKMPNNVTVQELVDKVRLKVLQGEDYLQRKITTSDISRPALEFEGYFKHYPAARIQLLGIT